jgi:hypothetical protein
VELTKQTLPIEDVGDTLWNGIDIQEKGWETVCANINLLAILVLHGQ